MIGRVLAVALLAAVATAPTGVRAQADAATFRDSTAARLYKAAVSNRERREDDILAYTATIRQRMAASIRTPLKDRTLWRLESAHRVFWKRDGDMLVQVLALREQTPTGVSDDNDQGLFDQAFDPMDDRLLFGFARRDDDLGEPDGDDFWFEHPLYPEYRDAYRFASGDTLTLSLPDGRRVQAIELQVVPKVASVHRMTGSLWIEPTTGALVRAVYRLADTFDAIRDIPDLQEEEQAGEFKYVPGLFKPWTAEIDLIAVDYSLWNFDVWLPRSLRAEGVISAGILKAPITIDLAYGIESVTTKEDLERDAADEGLQEVHFRTREEAYAYVSKLAFDGRVPYVTDPRHTRRGGQTVRFLEPEDPAFLKDSPELPPPVWEDAPGFASQDDLDHAFDGLAALPVAPLARMPASFRWGFQRPDLIRYNRVEALSVGARGQIRPHTPIGPISTTATVRLGLADLHPNVDLQLTRETLERRLSVRGYHELAAIDERARHLGIGNSLVAALFGRDDGDYYRRTGAELEWTPPSAARRSFRVRGYVERQQGVKAETDFSLVHAGSDTWRFRPNIAANDAWEYGASVELDPYWGSDPNLTQGGLDVFAQAATGDFEYARASLTGRLVVPMPARFRVALEVGAGTEWGTPSVQRLWYVGGPSTLRGYQPRVAGGTSFGRARAELARGYAFGRVSIFSDVGWAGDRSDIRWSDALYSIGAGRLRSRRPHPRRRCVGARKPARLPARRLSGPDPLIAPQ